ncbi:MAG: hypothetical protein KDJ29_18405 [Hyphomicrobiales bacterium]|nr:hypothetical protein [Hyphomicrobiales bacterium]
MTTFPYKHAHVIGIGGVGMSATAKLLRDSGVAVTGSDEAIYPPVSYLLRDEKLACATPYDPANIPAETDVFVIGKNARLVPETNAEVAAAFASGKPIVSFAEVLGMLSKDSQTLVAAGAFGKTTSVSLMAHCLMEAGLDPSFMIGAVPLSPPTPAHAGKGAQFLLEGDEYPSSNTDDRSKFLHYHPDHLLITPLAHDHVNVFPTIEDYLAPFSQLVAGMPDDGVVVASTGGELSKRFLQSLSRPVVTYGVSDGDWQVRDIVWGERSQFTILHKGTEVARLETGQLGVHNIENVLGVSAFLLTLELVDAAQVARAMASFQGIKRRLDRKSDKTSIPIFEGFGSSYDKARSAIAAMRQHFPGRELVVIFEPHTFSWRNKVTLHWYDDVFEGAEKVFVWHPAEQGSATHAQASQQEIIARIQAGGYSVAALDDAEAANGAIMSAVKRDSAVLFLTSGDLGGLIETLPPLVEAKYPA